MTDPEDLPLVCVMHGRFVPCRKDDPHVFTSDPDAVEAVREYQGSGKEWEVQQWLPE